MAEQRTYYLMKKRVKYHVQKLEEARETLKQMASGEFLLEDCPLKHDHYSLSQILFGLDSYHWDCGFCGKHHEV